MEPGSLIRERDKLVIGAGYLASTLDDVMPQHRRAVAMLDAATASEDFYGTYKMLGVGTKWKTSVLLTYIVDVEHIDVGNS